MEVLNGRHLLWDDTFQSLPKEALALVLTRVLHIVLASNVRHKGSLIALRL